MARPHRRLRPVGLEFLDAAPLRMAFSTAITASPGAVHRALAEDTENWPRWFGAVRRARPTADGRFIALAGGLRFEETVLAVEAPERYAYRADTVNRPGVRAIAEEWRVAPAGGGSLVQWTIAVEPAPAAAPFLRLSAPLLRAAFRRAMRRLDLRLATQA
ncbi:Polyketide cyclase / dehydrase and lipid transport [Actinacidiphila rubida]|uniref:Polyketide cyclase / dehydrase and lipid transport n=2 Tax=Actinacidiphila rubida TaxID=310780 RepID=A0A1H8QEI0_9ACTN|nr:SRPBCC family protein [Actinacidiphila rubida]SEO52411.1 Polyketide cyclase / dehydrase and lipid transport [Actinacidiphila rubida]